jgi:uncharacterized protein YndB with AHSA1/START domain
MSMTETAPLELTAVHTYDAPRAKVWAAWTDPERLKLWWGPKDFTTELFELDLRVGGAWRAAIRQTANGSVHGSRGVYREIVPGEKLVFSFKWDADGALDSLVTVTFADEGQGTRVTFNQVGFADSASRDSHQEGWNQLLDKLDPYLARESEA